MNNQFTLVTGAAGFIGARLTEKLLLANRNVIALDCFLPDLYSAEIKRNRWEKLKSFNSGNLELIEFDLRADDFSKLNKFYITSIFNEAAMPGLVNNWGDFASYYDCNLSALNRLLEFAKNLKLNSFVHASTSSVYGKKAIGDESQSLRPTSPYGVSKLAAEALLLAYLDWFNVPVRILRYFSVYGPNQRPDMAYSKIIRALLLNEEFVIFGDGEQKRSNTYIDDVVDATIRAESLGQSGDILNICGDETVSLNQVISILEDVSNMSLKTRYSMTRLGDQRDTSGLNKLAKERLSWRADTPIELGLKLQFRSAISSPLNSQVQS